MTAAKADQRPLKVLFVENGIGYGGAVICLRHLVRNLDRTRFEPIVVTGRTGPDYRQIATEARWLHIPYPRLDVAALRRSITARRWVRAVPGMRVAVLQLLARLDDVANFAPAFLQSLAAIARHRPALVHANNEPLCNRAAILAAKLAGVPIVSHVRGELQGSAAMRSMFQVPNHFITVSQWVADMVVALGVARGKVSHVYDGIELDRLNGAATGRQFRTRFGVPDNAFTVGLPGLLIPWKGQRLFLEAARILMPRIPELRMLIIGGTPAEYASYESELKEAVAREPFAGRIIFTGHVGDMVDAYAGLDVVLSASTSPEPLGTVVIESMAMGRPLIAPAHGGALEMVEHGRTGLLFTPGDAESLAQAIQTLHDAPARAKDMGTAARQEAMRMFAVEEHVHRVQEIYDHVLAARRAPHTRGRAAGPGNVVPRK